MTENNFKRLHDAYRHLRGKGMSRIEALKSCQLFYPDLNKEFCLAQERGESWTREPLDNSAAKQARNLSIVQNGGRLS